MRNPILMAASMGMAILLSGCISGKQPVDTYTGPSGKTTVIETDLEQCRRACNDDYSRCMDSTDARDNSGINGPRGMFGSSGECRRDLSGCMSDCKPGGRDDHDTP